MLQWLSFGILAGIVLLILLPPLARQTETIPGAERIGNAYATVSMMTLGSPSISVSPNLDFTLRKRAYSQQYSSEFVKKSGKVLRLTQIPNTVHRWGSKPFTFVDEKYGNTFDLRDVVFGRVEHEHRKDGEMTYSEHLYENGELVDAMTFVRAFLDVGSGTQVVDMDLKQSINPITDGSEDAQAWARLREAVRRMFLEQGKAMGLMRIIWLTMSPVAGMMAAFYLFGPGSLPGAAGGTTVGVGASLFGLIGIGDDDDSDDDADDDDDQPGRARRFGSWVSRSARLGGLAILGALGWLWETLRSVDRVTYQRAALIALLLASIALGFIVSALGMIVFLIALAGIVFVIALGSGVVLPAFPATISEPVAELWMQIGLMAFDKPTIHQDHGQITVVEADDVEADDDHEYRFCKHWVQFALEVDPDAFGRAGCDAGELEDYRTLDTVAYGGVEVASKLPSGWEATNKIANADHRGLVPKRSTAEDRIRTTWVRTDRWLGRFADSATGTICERAQEEATKEFAGSERPISDMQLVKYSLGLVLGGLIFGFVIWGGLL